MLLVYVCTNDIYSPHCHINVILGRTFNTGGGGGIRKIGEGWILFLDKGRLILFHTLEGIIFFLIHYWHTFLINVIRIHREHRLLMGRPSTVMNLLVI